MDTDIIKISMILLQFAAVMMNIFGLPGGIVSLLFPVILYLSGIVALKALLMAVTLVAAGELIEFYAAYAIGKRYKVDAKSFWVSVFGALFLGIVMAPMFFGLGTIIGTFAGAYLSVIIFETMRGATLARAKDKAKGVLVGRFIGVFAKLGFGLSAVLLIIKHVY